MAVETNKSENLEFDFIVVGGGTAGLAAAIAGARQGAKTAILQDRPMFGGNSSSEIRVAPLGSASFNGWSRETGILEEWLIEERARNHDDVYDGMANSHYDIVLLESAKAEPNLTLFMNTSLRGAETAKGKIVSITASQLGSEKEFLFKAGQFADCTGDATLGFLSGADFRYGREARAEHNENMAPVKADEQTMGSTLTMRARNIGRAVPFEAPPWAKDYRTLEDIGLYRNPVRFNRVDYGGYWWIEIGSPFHQIDDNQAIRDELLAHVFGVWDFVKNYSKDKDAAAEYALEWVGMVPGKRESRRLLGDVILTEDDCHNDKTWPDRVCHCGWFIDLHTMGGILKKDEPGEPAHADSNYRNWTRIAPFSLPLRSLYSRNIENLWMAGRDISVTHVALGSTRVMMTHAVQGQAVGTAAAYALKNGLSPRQASDPEKDHIRAIQQQLLKDDVHVMDCPNEDPDDLATGAKVSATSEAELDFGEPSGCNPQDLNVAHSQIFPVTGDRIGKLAVYLFNTAGEDIEVNGALFEQERIWDRKNGRHITDLLFTVPAGSEGWMETEVNTDVTAGKPHRLMLGAADGISWAWASLQPTGTAAQNLHRCPGGCEPQNLHMTSLKPEATDLPEYELWTQVRHWRLQFAVRITPAPLPFGSANVNGTAAWPLSMPNVWASDPQQSLPQSVALEFDGSREFNTVQALFDSHLDYAYHSMGKFWKAHSCAKDWNLQARINGEWEKVYEEAGNYKRRRKVSFDTVKADALKLEILNTNIATAETKPDDDPKKQAEIEQARSARVYEIRVYNIPC